MTLRYHTPLSAEEQRAFGIPDPQPIALGDRVRYAELDILNHVNNKAYMTWFETLRVAYFNRFCAPVLAGVDPGPRLVLRNATVHFIKEMLADEDYVTTARVTAFRRTSYTMEQQLWAGDLRATLTGVMVMRQPDGSAGWPLPDALCAAFMSRDGAVRIER